MELFEALGLNPKILLAQLINFAVLVFVLYRFGYKPMFEFLENRKNKIQKGIEDAEKAQENLASIEKKEKEVLVSAKKEAQELIKKAQDTAKKVEQDLGEKAQQEAENILAQAKKKIEEERKVIFQEVKKELAELVVASAKKVTLNNIDEEKSQKMTEEILNKNQK